MLAGGAATGVTPSAWLLAFAMFLFLSLAFLKRYAEMREAGPAEPANRRGYRAGDLAWLGSMGGASGYLSVLVLALYLNSEQVVSSVPSAHRCSGWSARSCSTGPADSGSGPIAARSTRTPSWPP